MSLTRVTVPTEPMFWKGADHRHLGAMQQRPQIGITTVVVRELNARGWLGTAKYSAHRVAAIRVP
jgi:hypothetical protein